MYNFSWELPTLFKISKTTVYVCPFKANDVKIKTTFSLKVTIKVLKVTFPWKNNCYNMIIVLNWIIPRLWLPLSLSPHMDLPTPMIKKKLFPRWSELFKIKIPPSLRGDTMKGEEVRLLDQNAAKLDEKEWLVHGPLYTETLCFWLNISICGYG